MTVRRRLVSALVASCLLSSPLVWAQAHGLPSLSEPALSPDGKEIAFVSGGDIWTVPAIGGDAHLLVSDPATESRPLYSPDGSRLAFISTRTGGGDIYVLTLATGQLTRITYADGLDQLDNWSADGQWIYFTSSINDVAGQGDIFRVHSTGGTPLEVSRERYLYEFGSAPSPDGKTLALVARGMSPRQWWRHGHSHMDETEVWLKPIASSGTYQRLLPAESKHGWPMWSGDGRTLYMMNDADGAENLWSVPVASPAQAKPLTHFKDGRVLWPSLGDSGKAIVFERNMAIWKMDLASGKAEAVPIALRGAAASPGITRTTETKFRGLALSPDGKKIAVLAHGQLFAASAKDGGEGQRVVTDASAAREARWSPDSLSLLYIAERPDDSERLEIFDFATQKSRPLTSAPGVLVSAEWSPDGKSVAYVHDQHDLHVIEVAGGKDRILAHGQLEGSSLAWSPDSRFIAFSSIDPRSFKNVSVVPAAGGTAQPISFLANGETAEKLAWSPDGKYILFDTSQRSEQTHIARVDLLPHVPRYKEDEFRELFRPGKQPGPPTPTKPGTRPETPAETPPALEASTDKNTDKPADKAPEKKKPEPVHIVFEGIRQRLTILPLGLGAEGPVISPDGKTLLFEAEIGNQDNLYTYSLDELSKEPPSVRQLTSTSGSKRDYAFSPDSKDVLFLENRGVRTIAVESRTPKPVAVTARVQVDFDVEKKVVFEEAWSTLNLRFFDPAFHGQNWKALHDQWSPYIEGARTGDELRRDINLMIGELNASHSGISRQPDADTPPPTRVGNLGLRYDRERYEAGAGLIVREVVTLGPASIEGSIKPGDKLVSINGTPIGAKNIDELLEDTTGRRTVLGVETAGKGRDVVLRPIASAAAVGLLYRQWVEERRAFVERISGGKVGYVHLADMSDEALQQLYLDLDAQNESKQGVVIDIRNNNGGYVNGYALDVFARRNYLEMTPRGMETTPSRQALGQRALGLPTVLVTNESTLSDGEDFTEGYRTLKLGKVVGLPTAGWIIYTGGHALIDGSVVRVPFIRVQDLRGETMEMHPRPVDVEVERPLGETETGSDAQLERAVTELQKIH